MRSVPLPTRPPGHGVPGGTAPLVRGLGAERIVDRLAVVLTLVAVAAYAWAAVAAAHRPYWMDEVLAVWTARQPGPGAVWDALRQGAEFSPPLYHWGLRILVAAGFDDPVSLRMPSILAIGAVGAAAYVLTRRRFDRAIACLALVLCLSGYLFSYAIQARPYALVAACFAWACVLRDGAGDGRVSPPRAMGLAGLLAVAIGLHFYAVLLAVALCLLELTWMLRHRAIRWPMVLAHGAAGASLLLWLPIIQAVSAFNQGDANAPDYYAAPTPGRLFATYVVLLNGDGALAPVFRIALVVALGARVLAGRGPVAARPGLTLLASGLTLVPIGVFVFSAAVTGTFNPRYVIVAALGLGLFAAQCVAAHRRGGVIACCLVALAAAAFLQRGAARGPAPQDIARELLAEAPAGLPIATGNGLRFLELAEGAKGPLARRLVYLMAPDLARSPDPTNAHQVQRWARIDRDLPVRDLDAFLAGHGRFVLFTDPSTPDSVPQGLRERGYTLTPLAGRDGMQVDLVVR